MIQNLKDLFVVLVLSAPAFWLATQVANSSITTRREFLIWRNLWFVVTIVAFASANYFVAAAATAIACIYARFATAASVALFFLLLFALPPIAVQVGGLGILNALIELNTGRVLALFLLLPILLTARGFQRANVRAFATPDFLILSYVVLMVILEFRRSELTQVLRVATRYVLDILIPYFACSRAVATTADVRKVFFAFIVGILPLAIIAIFETGKGWRLYEELAQDWGGSAGGYTARNDFVRAGATAGSITLGYMLMVGVGCLLAIRKTLRSPRYVNGIFIIFGLGMIATLSRGPWVGTLVLFVVFLATSSNAPVALGKFVATGAVVALILMITPVGDRFLNILPFIGSGDANTVVYRQELFSVAVDVIEKNLWLGSVDYMSTPQMVAWVQDHGFVDIVNTYLRIALETGIIGLTIFAAFFLNIVVGLWRIRKLRQIGDADFRLFARSLMAIILAILVTIATVSSITFIPAIYWSFAGLGVAVVRIGYRERRAAGAFYSSPAIAQS